MGRTIIFKNCREFNIKSQLIQKIHSHEVCGKVVKLKNYKNALVERIFEYIATVTLVKLI